MVRKTSQPAWAFETYACFAMMDWDRFASPRLSGRPSPPWCRRSASAFSFATWSARLSTWVLMVSNSRGHPSLVAFETIAAALGRSRTNASHPTRGFPKGKAVPHKPAEASALRLDGRQV